MDNNEIEMEQTFHLSQFTTVALLSAHAVIGISGFLTNWFVTRYVERRKDAMKLFRRLALAQFKASHPNVIEMFFIEFIQLFWFGRNEIVSLIFLRLEAIHKLCNAILDDNLPSLRCCSLH